MNSLTASQLSLLAPSLVCSGPTLMGKKAQAFTVNVNNCWVVLLHSGWPSRSLTDYCDFSSLSAGWLMNGRPLL